MSPVTVHAQTSEDALAEGIRQSLENPPSPVWAQTSEEAIAEGIRRSLEQSKPVECLAEEMTWRRVHGKRRRWAWARSFVDEVALRARREPRKFHVFLTHDWGQDELGRANHERVQKVNALLTAAGFTTWFDEERMRGDVHAKMAHGVHDSECVAVFITERYLRKASGTGPKGADDNCKFEFDSASFTPHLGADRMIPIVMEPRCRSVSDWPAGSVKGKLCTKLFIDLTDDDDDKFGAGVRKLIDELAAMTGKQPIADAGDVVKSVKEKQTAVAQAREKLLAADAAALSQAEERAAAAERRAAAAERRASEAEAMATTLLLQKEEAEAKVRALEAEASALRTRLKLQDV